jgi:hypothetical protein
MGTRQLLPQAVSSLGIRDAHGTTLAQEQSSSLGDGPFGGILDLAFPTDRELDFGSPLTLKSEMLG